ncbi:hypothetical protein LCGC14_2215610 [marine sediment metagenome]|uniref:FAD/NAD(P)-binding domain-containing protein n=1 Tax=marine sediment metagenome TaxID=412755 RepID=A0A0F9DCP1_9ZZZZ
MKVAILGAGPSAAYVTMACDESAVEYDIISNSSPTLFFPGAFWLNWDPTTILAEPATNVHVYSTGDVIGYLKKQWKMVDPDWLLHTSFPKTAYTKLVHNPYQLLGAIWKTKNIHLIRTLSDEDIKDIAEGYDLVFMTFATQESKDVMKSFVIKHPIVSYNLTEAVNDLPSDIKISNLSYCIYDGDTGHWMTRISQLFGYIHMEYSQYYTPKQELIGNGKVTWVQDTMPDTPEWDPQDVPANNVHLIGRHAQWSRKILSHDAYEQTVEILEQKL